MGIIFYWFGVNWLKFISRCNWVISFGRVSIYFWTIMYFLPFLLLFIQSVSWWILIFHIKVSNFLVDIWKLHNNKFLSSLIFTSIVFGSPLTSVSLFICCVSLLISLILSANFLFASDNYVCIFLIFVSKSLALFALLVFSTFRLFSFWIFSPLKCWFSSLNRLCIVSTLIKCSLMSFIKTSNPSDDTKPVGVELTHLYLLFCSTK